MTRIQVKNFISFLIFLGGLPIISKTMAMQLNPEDRMDAIINVQRGRLQQIDNINVKLIEINNLVNQHPVSHCKGNNLPCNTGQNPGQCQLQQHLRNILALTGQKLIIMIEIQQNQPIFERMTTLKKNLEELRNTLRKKEIWVNQHSESHCGGNSLLCHTEQGAEQCQLQHHKALIKTIQDQIRVTKNSI